MQTVGQMLLRPFERAGAAVQQHTRRPYALRGGVQCRRLLALLQAHCGFVQHAARHDDGFVGRQQVFGLAVLDGAHAFLHRDVLHAHAFDAGEQPAGDLAVAAAAGDPLARQAFERGANALAAMIASVGAVCDLDLVVIGGGVAKSGPLLFGPLRAKLAEYAGLDFLSGLRVVPGDLGGAASLIGAARLAGLS